MRDEFITVIRVEIRNKIKIKKIIKPSYSF
jgi:hypothetical protein